MKNVSNKQSGAVSLFVVIFFMLLVTVVTVSFLRLMVHDQQQATNQDLSQSAYDSAQAGVEDAKRAILKYQRDCNNNPASCGTLVGADQCNGALKNISGNGATAPNGKAAEIPVQQTQSSNDSDLNQAYTCVTIDMQPPKYEAPLDVDKSVLVPLNATSTFDRVRIEWFSQKDLTTSSSALSLMGVSGTGQPIYAKGQWPVNRPSLLRAQMMQFAKTGFNLSSFDATTGGTSNSNTLFLYPTSQAGIGERSFTAYDTRKPDAATDPIPKDSLNTPLPISCKTDLNTGGYACSAELVLPNAIGTSDATQRGSAFLRLTAFYNATHFRVTLWNGPIGPTSDPIRFSGAQAIIDSTGRANDVFRRVQSTVNLIDTNFPYPEATVDVTGNFCKDFGVTDTQYIAGNLGCTP